MTSLVESTFAQAIAELAGRDRDLAGAVARWGEPPFWTHEPGFPGLVREILSQQVSLESANAAFAKLGRRIVPIAPEGFLSLDDTTLKEVGFSRQKTRYVRGLAEAIVGGTLDLDEVGRMVAGEARQALLAVKGIGPWTADTYLLFALRRPDAWPSGDLALAKAIQELRGMESVPSYAEVDGIAEGWRPWRAVAARILWYAYLRARGR
ncbi:MAG: DNA-3-methyladenine glycosylase 2 family protein [Anaerolineae bacterium]|nr:DNA-3-methyladenine glycosylase 2 family protein [Anaerolineae bacterium]